MLIPPKVDNHLVVSYDPPSRALILRLNRPNELNAMNDALEADLRKTLDWAEDEPAVWSIIITGTGRLFCAGQDLKNWLKTSQTVSQSERTKRNEHGFGSISRRISRKTLICALNGHSFGGGTELLLNCDIIIGVKGGIICLPEVRRGVVASVGGIPNLIGRSPLLAPYLLTGLPIPASLLEAHILTEVVEADQVLPTALRWAQKIAECCPDAVWVTKEQINFAKAGLGVQGTVAASIQTPQYAAHYSGYNIQEGLKSFSEKRAPVWKNPPRLPSKL